MSHSSSNGRQAPASPTRRRQLEISYLGDASAVADRILLPSPRPAPALPQTHGLTPVCLQPPALQSLLAAHPGNQCVVVHNLGSSHPFCLCGRDLCIPASQGQRKPWQLGQHSTAVGGTGKQTRAADTKVTAMFQRDCDYRAPQPLPQEGKHHHPFSSVHCLWP